MEQPTLTAPEMRRLAPRPLPLHLAMTMTGSLGALAALPGVKAGQVPWHDSLAAEAAKLREALKAADPDRLAASLAAECGTRLQAMLEGIEAYRRHPYRRDLPPAREVWREGSTRLLEYGRPGHRGAPVLFVPSLVNRGYVLDLSRRRSLLRWLTRRGVRPYLIDWGSPGPAERAYGLSDYVAGRLERALERLVARTRRPVGLVGYCMGGDLALALALRRPEAVTALALLATPWDFHAGQARAARLPGAMADAMEAALETLTAALGEVPVDVVQAFFLALDPVLASRKFRRFARMDPASEAARDFVALEDWLNDGVPLAPEVARDCLLGWYGRNDPHRGEWLVAGAPVEPRRLKVPALVALPSHDRIVPIASAAALGDAIPRARTLTCPSGHIGMVVAGDAEAGLWRPLRRWLLDHRI